MSKPLAFGLVNQVGKKGAAKAKPAPFRKTSAFGGGDDSDNEEQGSGAKVERIDGDIDDFTAAAPGSGTRKISKQRPGALTQAPRLKSKNEPSAVFADLSSSLASRKNVEAATELDSSVYEYDSVYDSLKPKKDNVKEDVERKPKYMRSLLQAAEVRKRDALIAEEKKIAREREAEGDEYADKERFVTEAYRKQQEENRIFEEEEKRREEEEAKKNEGGGMSAFYRKLLDKDEARHTELVKAAAEKAKEGPAEEQGDDEDADREKAEADLVRELNEKGASVAVNEDGQVVDKRQLLRGGLNVGAKKKNEAQREASRTKEPERRPANGAQLGRRQAMRERQTRMMEEQLEQSLKRSREAEQSQREEIERATKSQKTQSEISSAKERYLARKRAAEEAKRQASGD
ncbi:coiled-coil domain-containing protein 55 [Metarhizium album ARSEF 1941]|uniref:Coiled-coil domain-containing protein 55 n=1 Tax=Metarhizium album (strain ARSEF 1941) TaxID=1081103 RepID=A0A0B2X2P6_METAS|nr:coiled-coil domain-containing protein 55 [Metarhizium album ARSEF 1941]KHN99545.1 coiled-coil domain-containing protein 55 [Metarhizium album ARSEF 1941]